MLRESPAHLEVALVGIDDDTARHFDEPMALWHRHYAQALQALAGLTPAAVGFDVVLPERSYDAIAPGYDREMVRGLALARAAYPLVLGITVDSAGNQRPLLPVFDAAVGEGGTGFVLWPLDADGAVRRFDERLGAEGARVPTLVGQLSRKLGREPGSGLIDFSRGAPLDYLPLQALLAAAQSGQLERLRPAIAGKIVLIGPLHQFEDRKRQPVNLLRPDRGRADAPGLLLHAQAVRSIFGAGLIRPLPAPAALLAALTFALVWFARLTAVRALLLVTLPSALLLALSLLLLDHQTYLPAALPLAGIVGAVAARGAYQGGLSAIQRQRLRAALHGYVSPQVAQDVLSGRLPSGFGGERYTLCVLFVDMRDFTPRSERMTPESLIKLANACFDELVAAVHHFDGTVVQFMGDGMMALFGAPNRLENPARAGFDAAREMLQRMDDLNARLRAEGVEPIRLGVGLNLGEAVVGHIGARSRYGYSAMGDMVNVASRLEGLTKEVSMPMVVSGSVAHALGSGHGLIALGARALKGHSPVDAFGWRPQNPNDETLAPTDRDHAHSS
jgi:class 3 adenylate cyclase